jgi:hypothetical protein
MHLGVGAVLACSDPQTRTCFRSYRPAERRCSTTVMHFASPSCATLSAGQSGDVQSGAATERDDFPSYLIETV